MSAVFARGRRDLTMPLIFKLAAVVCAALSAFRLCALRWQFELSRVVDAVVAAYESLLLPIRVALGPILGLLAGWFDTSLSPWWPHALVLWLVVGGIVARSAATSWGLDEADVLDRTLGALLGVSLGPIAFLFALIWSSVQAVMGDSELLGYLWRETAYVLLTTTFFFATNTVT